MDLLAAWVLFPAALLALCLGLGLLLQRLSAWRMPGALLLPVGFATLLALARLITATGATAPLALPIIVVLALAGLVLGARSLRRPDPWLAAAAVGVFAVFAAPVVLSGDPTFAGYLVMPDSGHQLTLAWLYAHHGPDWQALATASTPSGSTEYIGGYVTTAYPVAAQAALGVTAPLGLIDLAWLYQPFITVIVVMGCLAVAELVRPWVGPRWLRALVVFVVAQPALLVGYALQGSIKELAAAALIALVVALLVAAAREQRPARSLLALAVTAAAAIGALGPSIGPYLVLPFLAVLWVWGGRYWRRHERADLLWLAAGGLVAVVLILPLFGGAGVAVRVHAATLEAQRDLGNLAEPLSPLHALGVWLNGDYRYRPQYSLGISYGVPAVVALGALFGALWLLRARAVGLLLLVATVALPSLYLLRSGSPYADAKVLMILSPTVLLLALLGALSLREVHRRVEAGLLTGLIAAGVVASSALAYHDVSLAPHARYAELLHINERLAGRGPAITTEYDEFGKYFLRDVPAQNLPEYPLRFRASKNGESAGADERRRPSLKSPVDLDDLEPAYVQSAPYIVMRRSPTASRPPANYARVFAGDYYDVWQRRDDPRVLDHLPLNGDVFSPSTPLSCAVTRTWARRARRAGARLAYVERDRAPILVTGALPLPSRWRGFGLYPGGTVPFGPGGVAGGIPVSRGGRYEVWIEGSYARPARIYMQGRLVGRAADDLNNPGAYTRLGAVRLGPGTHRVKVVQGGGTLAPGSGGYSSNLRHIGPIVFVRRAPDQGVVQTADPGDWRRLCGKRLDWLEIVSARAS
jgi:hypothetical protein